MPVERLTGGCCVRATTWLLTTSMCGDQVALRAPSPNERRQAGLPATELTRNEPHAGANRRAEAIAAPASVNGAGGFICPRGLLALSSPFAVPGRSKPPGNNAASEPQG